MTRRKPYSEITAELKDIIKFLDTLNEKIMEARKNRGMSELAKRVAGMIKVQHSLPHAPRLADALAEDRPAQQVVVAVGRVPVYPADIRHLRRR